LPPRAAASPPALHDALPIYAAVATLFSRSMDQSPHRRFAFGFARKYLPPAGALCAAREGTGPVSGKIRGLGGIRRWPRIFPETGDRKSTRLNSSHVKISYAV